MQRQPVFYTSNLEIIVIKVFNMLHLCYIHVYDYRVLSDIDVTFDHRYSFRINDGVLKIRRADVLPRDFWGRGIYSLTAIMGNGNCSVNPVIAV